jgi:hypothetical protein
MAGGEMPVAVRDEQRLAFGWGCWVAGRWLACARDAGDQGTV